MIRGICKAAMAISVVVGSIVVGLFDGNTMSFDTTLKIFIACVVVFFLSFYIVYGRENDYEESLH